MGNQRGRGRDLKRASFQTDNEAADGALINIGRVDARILVVEDDFQIANLLDHELARLGYRVLQARNGAQALAGVRTQQPHLMLLDMGLPDFDGSHVLRQLRAEGNALPIIVLTARDQPRDRVEGLRSGADDYVVKPFDLAELDARIHALLRRAGHGAALGLSVGCLQLLPDEMRITLGGEPLALTARELLVLRRLMKSHDRVVTKGQLLETLAELNEEIAEKAVEVYIHRIRQKLIGHEVEIVTVRGFGYLLRASETAA